MNQAKLPCATNEAARLAAPTPTRLPRRQRIGSAIASVLVSGVLLGSVVLGMTSLGDEGRQIVGQAHAATRA
jgi:hypothetical protein